MPHHQASVEECMKLLPREVLVDKIQMARTIGLTTVWMVDEDTDMIESGYIIDTRHDQFFSFIVRRELDLFEMLPVSDWQHIGELSNELDGLPGSSHR